MGPVAVGLRKLGHQVETRESRSYPQGDEDEADLLAVWGDYHGVERILADVGKHPWQLLQIDNGYLRRGHFSGYYSLSYNARQASAYLWDETFPPDRFLALNESILPWRTDGSQILILAPSRKHAHFLGLNLEQWCRQVKARCQQVTDKRIVTMVKTYNTSPTPREYMQNEAVFAVVGYNTKSMVEALLEGIPVFPLAPCVVERMGMADVSRLTDPVYPENREDFFARLAYQQWRLDEIAEGKPWTVQ